MEPRIDHPLARARKDAGLTQQDLSNRSGVSIRAIQNAEAGISPHRATKLALALALGVRADTIWISVAVRRAA